MGLPPADSREEFLRDALNRYEAGLMRYARRMLGGSDAARDAVQETFLRLCRQEPARVADRLPAWLYTVCRNEILDMRRRRRVACPLAAAPHSPAPDPYEALESNDEADRLLALVGELPETQAEALHLKFAGGLSYRGIADVLGVSVPNAGFLIHRGLTTLRERWKRIEAGTERPPADGPPPRRPTIPLRREEGA